MIGVGGDPTAAFTCWCIIAALNKQIYANRPRLVCLLASDYGQRSSGLSPGFVGCIREIETIELSPVAFCCFDSFFKEFYTYVAKLVFSEVIRNIAHK